MAAPRGRHQDSGRARLARPLRPVAARPWRSPRNAPGGRARPRPDRRHRGDRLGSLGAVEPVEVAERRGRVHPLPVRRPRPGHGLVRPPAGAAGQRPRGQPVDRAARRGRPRGAGAVRGRVAVPRGRAGRARRATRSPTSTRRSGRSRRTATWSSSTSAERVPRSGWTAREPTSRRSLPLPSPATWPPASRCWAQPRAPTGRRLPPTTSRPCAEPSATAPSTCSAAPTGRRWPRSTCSATPARSAPRRSTAPRC